MILDVWTAFLWIFVNIYFWTHPNGRLRDPSLSLLVAGDIRLSWEGASQRLINPLTSPHHVTLQICKYVYIHDIWKCRLHIILNQTSGWVGRVPATSATSTYWQVPISDIIYIFNIDFLSQNFFLASPHVYWLRKKFWAKMSMLNFSRWLRNRRSSLKWQ